jgi:dsRNA-specific ribonuclease
MTELTEVEMTRIALKVRQLVSPGLVKEDVERLISRKNVTRISHAFTHRDTSEDNLETDEITGDKANGYVLISWLRRRFPNTRSEAILSIIIAKFLSKEKLAQYSKDLGLAELLRKPKNIRATEGDYEDVFEAVMGALTIVGDETFGAGAGILLVRSILEPIFEREGIDPAKVRDYYDAVSLLKMATNVKYGEDPKTHLTQIRSPDGSYWYSATVFSKRRKELPEGAQRQGGFQKVEYEETMLAELTKTEYAKNKQRAKEAVSRKALTLQGWTYDTIIKEREKKDADNQQRYREQLSERIASLREEVLSRRMLPSDVEGQRVKLGRKTITVAVEVERKRADGDDDFLLGKYGKELAHELTLPVEAKFETEKDEDDADVVVILFTTSAEGVYVSRANVRERPTQLQNGYRRLVPTYLSSLRERLGLPPVERRKAPSSMPR